MHVLTQTPNLPALAGDDLLDEVSRRAFRFFWEQADPRTGLINDRAGNFDKDGYRVASVAATGYGLAALAAGCERGWATKAEAFLRARRTLAFLLYDMPHQHGWFYHFIDKRTGARVWRCEVSSIDTALLVIGALACGRYFAGTEVETLANRLYDRLDWTWMRTRGGTRPDSLLLSHGWTPERGFLPTDWDTYSEGMLLYQLGIGARREPVPAAAWAALRREVVHYGGFETLTGGPLFLNQMWHGWVDLREKCDALGWDYGVSAAQAARMNRQFCINHAGERGRQGYGPNGWGLNASDGPKGYRAYGGPGPAGEGEDGTLCPTATIASLPFTPDISRPAADDLYRRYGARLWGRYGFSNAFNAGANRGRGWFDDDAIGIDLGMALLAIENSRTGLFWRLLADHPSTVRAFRAVGMHRTFEIGERPLRMV